MCAIPTWMLFEGGKHDLAKLDPPRPSLAWNRSYIDHFGELRGHGIGLIATGNRVRPLATLGADDSKRPFHVFPTTAETHR